MSKVIDSHLHVWASPQEAAEKYPYFPGQVPSLPGHVDYLLECAEEVSIKIRRLLPRKSSRRWSGIKQLEDLVLKMTNGEGIIVKGWRAWSSSRFHVYEGSGFAFARN